MRLNHLILGLASFFAVLGFIPEASWSKDAPASKHVDLIGKFNKAQSGAVTFTADEEPDVVYMPMRMTTNPSDYLNIYVKVTGSVTDSFQRGDKTVKIFTIDKITPMTEEYGSTRTSGAGSYGVRGSWPVEIHKYEDHTCYLYENYAVQETAAEYSNGMDLMLVKRKPGDDPIAVCENMKAEPYMLIKNEGDNHFYGLAGNRLFVDDGAGPEPHALIVYDLTARQDVFTAPFFTPVTLKKDRLLEFASIDDHPIKDSCPKTNAWARQGKKTVYRIHVQVDLANFAVTEGQRDCAPGN